MSDDDLIQAVYERTRSFASINILRAAYDVGQSALQAKEAEIAALRADAERYWWLRAHTSGQRDARGRQEFDLPDPHPIGNIMQGSVAQHLDAAIDSARAAVATQEAK